MVSLDLWREKLGISPKENQGAVIAAARDEAKEYLRKKQPFVWNATNISEQIRSAQISLFEDYGASVRTVFLETEWGEEMRRNGERKATVPTSAIEKMLQKLEIPERSESAEVEWKIV
jgi:predicted kinase